MKTCCIISKTPRSWSEFEGSQRFDLWADEMDRLIRRLNGEGVTTFITSMNRGAETLCAASVLNLKSQRPGVRLEVAVPFEEQAKEWSEAERDRYFDIISKCDAEALVSNRFTLASADRCYEYMLSRSEVVIISESTAKDLEYVLKSNKNQNKRYIYI